MSLVTPAAGRWGDAGIVETPEVEVVRENVDAFNRRDLEGILATLDPDVELLPFSAQLSGETYRGLEGARRWLGEIEDEWSEWQVVLDELRPIGSQVLATARIFARGRETGIDVEMPVAFLATVGDGRVTRLDSYSDATQALAAADAR